MKYLGVDRTCLLEPMKLSSCFAAWHPLNFWFLLRSVIVLDRSMMRDRTLPIRDRSQIVEIKMNSLAIVFIDRSSSFFYSRKLLGCKECTDSLDHLHCSCFFFFMHWQCFILWRIFLSLKIKPVYWYSEFVQFLIIWIADCVHHCQTYSNFGLRKQFVRVRVRRKKI